MKRRTNTPPQRFDRHGLLAIEPKAFFELFMVPEARGTQRAGNVDVIEISGPIVQRDEMWCDSYESIRARFKEALESDSSAIVLRFDSPGGDASGCFETARALRADALAAGKPLYSYVDKSCSAAFALASAATHGIAIGETCCAGSIGVISSRPDYTAQNTSRGMRFAFVVSGTRKLDGNPDYPITEAELEATQKHVDALAGKFFALLEDMRPQLSAAQVAGFDGGVFYGENAVANGLADAVLTFDELLARASGGDNMSLQAKSEYDAARTALEKIAKGDDANAAAAKRALAAMAESEPEKEPDGDEEKEPEGEESEGDESKSEDDEGDEPKSEASDDEPPADKKKAEAKAGATSSEINLAAELQKLRAEVSADREARTRRALLAKRPDFGPEVRAVLAKAPIATLREAVEKWPKAAKAKGAKPVAVTTVAATRGATQTDADKSGPTRLSTDADLLDERMGFKGSKLGCRRNGTTLEFGVVDASPSDASKGAA